MRGAGSPGLVAAARTFLGQLALGPFGSSNEKEFRFQLDTATSSLLQALPPDAQRWGRARQSLNIFLRDCLYTTYTREDYRLALAENFFEVPLDSITGKRIVGNSPPGSLPKWQTVRALTPEVSQKYQERAASIAGSLPTPIPRVHLDAIWWGQRQAAEQSDAEAE